MRATPDDIPHTLADQLMAKVERLLQERRQKQIPVETERRGLNPQRNGWEDQSDVNFALDND